jgi:hypothetical protein
VSQVQNHPLQSDLWEDLARVMTAVRWSDTIGVNKSTVSRWMSGECPMSVDDWGRVMRVCRRQGRADIAERIVTRIVEDLAGGPAAPKEEAASPMEVAMTAAVNGGDTVRALQDALADGHISPIEARRIDELAEKHAKTSRDLAALAAEARAQRAMPRAVAK